MMKKLMMLSMVVFLSGLLATAALAKPNFNAGNLRQNVTNNAKIEAKRQKAELKAAEIHSKRDNARQNVDAKMKERLRLIRQGNPGNTGPLGN